MRAPVVSNRKEITGRPVRWSKVGAASMSRSPVRIARRSIVYCWGPSAAGSVICMCERREFGGATRWKVSFAVLPSSALMRDGS